MPILQRPFARPDWPGTEAGDETTTPCPRVLTRAAGRLSCTPSITARNATHDSRLEGRAQRPEPRSSMWHAL